MPRPTTPLLAADTIIRLTDHHDDAIVVIKRRNPPLGWALPGGFVDLDESVSQAAKREALEETGLAVTLDGLVGCYSAPGRDPRGATTSIVFAATAQGTPVAGDDAGDWQLIDPQAPLALAFDHATVVADYCRWLRGDGYQPPVR